MVIFGIDAHKRTHTVVAIDEAGRELGQKTTTATTTEAHLDLVRWADRFGSERRFAVEDCRHCPGAWRPTCWPRVKRSSGSRPS